jgi:hypothetical protein
MNTKRLDSILEEIEGAILLDFMHTIEELTGRKPERRLASRDEMAVLDYMFADGLYPISDDSDYLELGEIFRESI